MIAVVAGPALLNGIILTKIGEQEFPAAAGSFAKCGHIPQFAKRDARMLSGIVIMFKHGADAGTISPAIEEDTIAVQTIPPGTPGFLVIGLKCFGQIVMHNKPDVRFVYTHTKSDGGTDNGYVVMNKRLLHCFTDLFWEPRVVRGGSVPVFFQFPGQIFCLLLAHAVDDTGIVPVLA